MLSLIPDENADLFFLFRNCTKSISLCWKVLLWLSVIAIFGIEFFS